MGRHRGIDEIGSDGMGTDGTGTGGTAIGARRTGGLRTAWLRTAWLSACLVATASAQDAAPPAQMAPARVAVAERLSDGARAALAAARELAGKARDLEDDERAAALQAAAAAFDRVSTQFAGEGPAAAQAAFAAAELWRRQGSPELAEHDYQTAARLDPQRYGLRGKIGAADMQRRLDRDSEALATYAEAIALAPESARAQTARLWRGRLLQRLGRGDEAMAAFAAAVEAGRTPQQVIEACNYLARSLIERGDLEAAGAALGRADAAVRSAVGDDAEQQERLHKALDAMSSRRALQRARDKKSGAAADAQALEAARQRADATGGR